LARETGDAAKFYVKSFNLKNATERQDGGQEQYQGSERMSGNADGAASRNVTKQQTIFQ